MIGSGPYSGLIIRSPVNPFPKRSRSQNLRPSPQAKSTRQKKRSRSFEICFMGAKTLLPFGGKEKAASLATRLLAAWTGVPSVLRNRKIEIEGGARRGYSNH